MKKLKFITRPDVTLCFFLESTNTTHQGFGFNELHNPRHIDMPVRIPPTSNYCSKYNSGSNKILCIFLSMPYSKSCFTADILKRHKLLSTNKAYQ